MQLPKLLALIGLAVLAACDAADDGVQGYVEGETVFVALPSGGRIEAIAVKKGQTVGAGDVLFRLDSDAEEAAVAEAEARLEKTRAEHDNLLTGLRSEEIRVIEMQKAQADAARSLALTHLRRQEKLVRDRVVAQARLDEARASADESRARVEELEARLETARLAARTPEITAAKAAVTANEAALKKARWALSQRIADAPAAGRIEDVYFRVGEVVADGQPVVGLLPPENVVLRFYLNTEQVGALKPDESVGFSCSGCPDGLTATVSWIASEAAYAPPILYSREANDKLVFLVEARPDARPPLLHPGQPITVTLP